jgi:hypothetical protein
MDALIDLYNALEHREKFARSVLRDVMQVYRIVVRLRMASEKMERGEGTTILREEAEALLSEMDGILVSLGIDADGAINEFKSRIELGWDENVAKKEKV